MNSHSILTTDGETTISLASGKVVNLPICHPQFSLWREPVNNFNYGGKPLINHNNEPIFAELAILRILQADGWEGVWVETYGGTHFLQSMPKEWKLKSEHVSIPKDKEELLKKIWKTAKTTACFDIFAWKGKDFIFCEAKNKGKDKLTNGQIKFIEGALFCGILPESLLIVEWEGN
ncbi:MAG: hypothetical protein WCW29_01555 [Candidatus Paceibacterota bacterium]